VTLDVSQGDEDEGSWLQSESQLVSDSFSFLDNGKIGQKDAAPRLRMSGNKLMKNKEEKRL
jgi:hypothetical protein